MLDPGHGERSLVSILLTLIWWVLIQYCEHSPYGLPHRNVAWHNLFPIVKTHESYNPHQGNLIQTSIFNWELRWSKYSPPAAWETVEAERNLCLCSRNLMSVLRCWLSLKSEYLPSNKENLTCMVPCCARAVALWPTAFTLIKVVQGH